MSDFVKLKEKFLAHDFQSAHLLCVLLGCQEDLSVATLSDLGEDLKISLTQSCATFTEIGTFSSKVLVLHRVVFRRSLGWCRVLCVELPMSKLSLMYIVEKIEVVVEEVCRSTSVISCRRPVTKLTDLSDISQPLYFRQLKLFKFFCGKPACWAITSTFTSIRCLSSLVWFLA